jgi:hypothetical protein
MSWLTLDVEELRKRWVGLYVNLMALLSDNPEVKALLEPMKESLTKTNEELMAFFKRLAELNEVEGDAHQEAAGGPRQEPALAGI